MVLGGSSSGGRLGTATLDLRANAGPLNKGLERSEKNVRRSTGRMGKAVKVVGFAFAGAGVAAAGVGVAALKLAADFDKAFSEVRTLLPNVSDEAFGALQKDLRDFSNETGTVTTEAIPALYQAISAGVPRENVMDFLRVANKAAVGGVTDLETAVDAITSSVNSYGPEVLSATEASDLMFTAVRLGKTTFDELGAALFNVVPTAASFGVGLDQVAAALAVTTAQGVPTKIATTQLRQAFVEAGKESSILAKTIKERTGKSFSQLIKEGKPVHRIFQDLREDMPEDDFRNLFSSVEAANAALLITGDAAERVDDALAEMSTSAGATDKAFATVADTATFRMQKAMNLMRNVLLEIGIALLPALVEVLDRAVLPALTAFAGWMSDHSDEMAAGVIAVVDAAVELGSATKTAVNDAIAAYTRFITWGENNVDRAKAFWTDTTAAATAHKNEGVVTAQYAYIALLRWGSENKAELEQLWTDTASAASDVKTTINDEVVPAYEGVLEWTTTNAETVKGFWKDTESTVADLGTAIDTKVAVPLAAVSTWHTDNRAAILGVWEEANTRVANLSASISGLGDIEVKFPELELPELKAPELPELKTPELFVPKLELPKEPFKKVDLGLGKKIGEDLKAGFEELDIGMELPTFDPLAEGLDTVKLKTGEMSLAFQTAGPQSAAALNNVNVGLDNVQAGLDRIDEGWLRTAALAAGAGALIIGGPFGLAAMGISATLLAKNYLPAVRSWFDQNAPGIAALMNPWLVKIEEFSGSLQTSIKSAVDTHVIPALDSVRNWFETNKPTFEGIWAGLSDGFTDVGSTIKTELGDIWANTIIPAAEGFKNWTKDNEGLIGESLAASGRIAASAWDTYIETAQKVFGEVMAAIETIAKSPAIQTLTDFFEKLVEKFMQWMVDNEESIKGAINVVGDAVVLLYKGLMLLLKLALIPLNEIWKVMSPVILFVVDALLKVLGTVFWLIDRLDELDDAWEDLKVALDGVKEKWDEIWGGIASGFKGYVNVIIDGINAIIRGWNRLEFTLPEIDTKIFGKVGGWTIGTPDIKPIPKLDEGGIVTGPTLVALAMDRQDEVVMPLRDLDMMMNGGRTMVFNVENLYGVDDLEDFVQEANLAALRRGQENVLT